LKPTFGQNQQTQAESIGWLPLEEGEYLHLLYDEYLVTAAVDVVGLPKPEMQGSSALWLFKELNSVEIGFNYI
jgi:hypothetical protein